MTGIDRSRWDSLFARHASAAQTQRLFEAVCQKYREPHRAYHNLSHVQDCLSEFEALREKAESADAVEFAIWFHDVIYDPKAKNNEEASAEFASRELSDLGFSKNLLHKIQELILMTRHREPPVSVDEQIIVDVDLAVLGKERAVFERYDRAIRREYAWISDEQYREGRGTFLTAMLARERLFHTAYAVERYEKQARENLARSLKQLFRQMKGDETK